MEWNQKKIVQLTQLWGEGLPPKDIALKMEVSVNAVIGKAFREGLRRDRPPAKNLPRSHKKKVVADETTTNAA